MAEDSLFSGKCLCGAITAVISADPLWVGHCHCPSCQKATSAGYATYAGFARAAVIFKGDQPKVYKSSPGVKRRFCGRCGSPVSFEGETWPGEIHLHAAFLDQAEGLQPTGHTYLKTRLPWVPIDETLEQHETFSGEDGHP